MTTRLLIACIGLVIFTPTALFAQENGQQIFDTQIAPLLSDRCLDCHSGSEPKGQLDLSSHQSLLQGGESGAAVTPGNVDESLLWQRIASDEMPPNHPLDARERALLRVWIADGALWGQDPIDRFR